MKFKPLATACLKTINNYLEQEDKPLSNKELLAICASLGNLGTGSFDPHLPHEIAEAALNYLIFKNYATQLLRTQNPEKSCRNILRPLTNKLPTQSWRSEEQLRHQQFSTPPQISYLLTYIMEINHEDSVLEPSAGTGNLAIWAKAQTQKVYTNEISRTRRQLLEWLGFTPTEHNGEFIQDYLPPTISPSCLIMNPPFSSNGGRTTNSSKFGFRYVESALERLKKWGKFGIILGKAGGLDTKSGYDFWRKLSQKLEIKSIIKIDGREYYKNGTTVDINLITGKKLLETRQTDWNQGLNKITNISVSSVEEACLKVNQLNLRLDR